MKSISTLLQIHAIHKFLCGYNSESPVTDSKSQSVTGKTVVAVQPELSLSEAFSMLVPGDLDKINEVASVQLFCHSEVIVELDILATVNQCIVIALRWL